MPAKGNLGNLPEEVYEDFLQTLRGLQEIGQLSACKLVSCHQVAERIGKDPDLLPHQALRAILTETLDDLAKEETDQADILRGRFWEGLQVSEMLDAGRPWGEGVRRYRRAFQSAQRKAVQNFALLFLSRENRCRRKAEANTSEVGQASSAAAPPVIPERDSMHPLHWPDKFRWLLRIAGTLAVVVLLSWAVLALGSPSLKPDQVTFCGEISQVEDAPTEMRFRRDQGVSAFTAENTPGGILNNHIRALAANETGVWIGYIDADGNGSGGLSYLDKSSGKKTWVNCNESGVTVDQRINAIAIDKAEKVWVATDGDGVLMFDGEEWRTFTAANSELPSDMTYGLTVDDDDHIWVATWGGIAKFDGATWDVKYSAANGLFSDHSHAIAFDSLGNIWVGHINDGLSQFDNASGEWIHHQAGEGGPGGDQVRSVVVNPSHDDQPESVWIATADGGVSRFIQGQWTIYGVEDGLPGTHADYVAVDRYHRVWTATDEGSAYFDGDAWLPYTSFPTLAIGFGPDCPDPSLPCEDNIWTGTNGFGLTHSRMPYPTETIDVIEACFDPPEGGRICTPLDPIADTRFITATYPGSIAPGDDLQFSLIVRPRSPYQLREDRGDFLSNADSSDTNLFGAYPIIPVKGTIDPGQTFEFVDYNNPFQAPELADGKEEGTFVSTWRVWMHTKYVGPYVRVVFTVRRP